MSLLPSIAIEIRDVLLPFNSSSRSVIQLNLQIGVLGIDSLIYKLAFYFCFSNFSYFHCLIRFNKVLIFHLMWISFLHWLNIYFENSSLAHQILSLSSAWSSSTAIKALFCYLAYSSFFFKAASFCYFFSFIFNEN